ncbi:MAG: cell envelope integrity protein CreD [Gammaproteobacteria bacterium]|nr:cell envelope integrity protein CreD [Gammaproteobacteria bacterium]
MLEFFIAAFVIIAILLVIGFGGFMLLRWFLRDKDGGNNSGLPMPDFRQHLPTRFVAIALMAIALFIPLGMIEGVVSERHRSYRNVLHDVSSSWGKEQILTGPVLVIPYKYRFEVTKKVLGSNGIYQDVSEWRESSHEALVLPDQLNIGGDIEPEYRQRSIYKSLVYRMRLKITGQFDNVEHRIREMTDDSRMHKILWDKAYLSIGLSDPSGVEDAQDPVFNGQSVRFSPGTKITKQLPKGIHIPLSLTDTAALPFNLKLTLKGSKGFRVAPVGERTAMQLKSDWEHPSFYGDLLPKDFEIIAGTGFNANWSVSRLVRSYPQQWVLSSKGHKLNEMSLGVQLFEPVTLYTETTRAVKYGVLFISLTFIALLLIEWVTGIRPGFLQYFMIGSSLALFYLLLIALAEHTGFALAYGLATFIVIGMIGLYSLSILRRRALAGLVSIVLLSLYSVLYLILQSEDYALLSGTLLITVTLAASMYFSSKADVQTLTTENTIGEIA